MSPGGTGAGGRARSRGRQNRLTRPSDFRRVRRGGKSFGHALAVLHIRSNGLTDTRLGVTTDRALTGAVRRNRAKRRMREILRRLVPRMRRGFDVVVVARPPAVTVEFSLLDRALRRLVERGGLWEGTNGNPH